jgi:hypothetical protein
MTYIEKDAFFGIDNVNLFQSHFSNVYKPNLLNNFNINTNNKIDNSLFCVYF